MPSIKKPKALSSNVLKMKFMQRGVESDVRRELEEKQKLYTGEMHWIIPSMERGMKKSTTSTTSFEPSFQNLKGLSRYGRRSYKAFNKEVEAANLQ
eukprot:CFRG4963T1